jgi:hypothetical protein
MLLTHPPSSFLSLLSSLSSSDADGDFLGKQDWDAAILHECGGEWLVARHSDVRDAVLSAARANGATVRFNARVVSFDESRAQVTLENGEVISADVVVGADGINSAMRSSIFEDEEDIIETDQVMFRSVSQSASPWGNAECRRARSDRNCSTMIPVEKMRADPETAHISIDGTITCWYGDLHCAIGYAAVSFRSFNPHTFLSCKLNDFFFFSILGVNWRVHFGTLCTSSYRRSECIWTAK